MKDSKVLTIFRTLSKVGKQKHSLLFKSPFEEVFGSSFEVGGENAEIASSYFYIQSVLDQGGDVIGVDLLMRKITKELYEKGIQFLHHPLQFFSSISEVFEVVRRAHEEVKEKRGRETGIRGYNLMAVQRQRTKITPYISFCLGTPLLVLLRLRNSCYGGLLNWLKNLSSGEKASEKIREDNEYGLGRAIGYKACRLFVKHLIHNLKILKEWSENSYLLPFNSNVGRVLSRSGAILAFISWKDFQEQTEKSEGARRNIIANRLFTFRRPMNYWKERLRKEGIDPSLADEAASLLWPKLKRKNLPLPAILNAVILQLKTVVGYVDDGIMYVGVNFCKNLEVLCDACPLQRVCLANNGKPELKEKYFCGTSKGVFW